VAFMPPHVVMSHSTPLSCFLASLQICKYHNVQRSPSSVLVSLTQLSRVLDIWMLSMNSIVVQLLAIDLVRIQACYTVFPCNRNNFLSCTLECESIQFACT
jgi:hypothetical protein